MAELTLTTFNWVPELPRGYVRDLRVRWALEEAGLPYRVESVPFDARGAGHLSRDWTPMCIVAMVARPRRAGLGGQAGPHGAAWASRAKRRPRKPLAPCKAPVPEA